MALALGVIALVVSWRKPEGGYVQWYADSFAGIKKDHLSTDGFAVAHQDTGLDQIFNTFEEYDGEAYLSPQEINDNFIDFKASPGAQKVVVTAEEIILRTQQIARDGSKRAAKAATPVAKNVYRKARGSAASARTAVSARSASRSSSAESPSHSASARRSKPSRERSAESASRSKASAPHSASSPDRPSRALRTKRNDSAA